MNRIYLERRAQHARADEAFEKFIRMKKRQNLSVETINFYNDCFRYFGEFFDVSQDCSKISLDTYYDYIEHLQTNKKANPTTINSYLRGLRTILYYFMDEGYTLKFKMPMIKAEKQIKETYTEEELEKLLRKPDVKKCNFTEYRNWVMANYFLATGNRLRTVINIKIGHLDFENYLIFLGKTKNGKQQLIPMSKSLADILQEYLSYRQGNDDDYLFCSMHGEQLTRDGTSTLMRKYNLRRGVRKTSIHMYRHTFAKNWILNGGDIFRLQKILGHSTMDMVKNYVEMFDDDLKRDFETFNPLDNMLKDKKGDVIRMRNKR